MFKYLQLLTLKARQIAFYILEKSLKNTMLTIQQTEKHRINVYQNYEGYIRRDHDEIGKFQKLLLKRRV